MQNIKSNAKKVAIIGLLTLNIFTAGAVFGAYQWNQYTTKQASKTQNAVQAALKSVPVAQAASLAHGQ
jgi:uncharacterized membrane protein